MLAAVSTRTTSWSGSWVNAPTVYHSTGDAKWSSEQGSPDISARDVSGTGPSDIYVLTGHVLYHSSGDGTWTPDFTNEDHGLARVFARSPDAVYVCTGDGLLFRSNGAGVWSDGQTIDAAKMPGCTGIWGDETELYLATSSGMYHGRP